MPSGPIIWPNPGPTLDNEVAAAVKAVKKSKFNNINPIVNTRKANTKIKKKLMTDDTMASEIDLLL